MVIHHFYSGASGSCLRSLRRGVTPPTTDNLSSSELVAMPYGVGGHARIGGTVVSMKEIAPRVTSVLRVEQTPDPLFIALWNEPPSEAPALIRAVLAERHDEKVGLRVARMPKAIWYELANDFPLRQRPRDLLELSACQSP